jgi:4a-hydroxytetrahydrobiopterin dehydratase
MDALFDMQCQPPGKEDTPLHGDELKAFMAQLHQDWRLNDDETMIARDFTFSNFHETMAFVNAMAWIAHQQDHHPDFCSGYRHCEITYSTHAIGGLSINDFICAARIDRL